MIVQRQSAGSNATSMQVGQVRGRERLEPDALALEDDRFDPALCRHPRDGSRAPRPERAGRACAVRPRDPRLSPCLTSPPASTRSWPRPSGSTRRLPRSTGEHHHDDRWPDLSAAGRAALLDHIDGWLAEFAAGDRADGRRGHRSRPAHRRARGCPVRRDRAARGRLEPAGVGLPHRRRPVHAQRPRVRPAGRPAGIDRRAPRGPARGPRRGDRRRWSGPPIGRSVGSRPRPRSSSCPGSTSSSPTRCARPRRPPRPTPAVADAPAAAQRRRRDRAGRGRRLRDASVARSSCRRAAAKDGSARSCSRRRCATRCARRRSPRTASSSPRNGSSPRSGRRWSASRATCGPSGCGDEAVPGDDGALVRGVLDAIAFDHPDAARAARLLSRGERPDRGLLRRPRPDRPGRRAARDRVDAGLPARVRRGDAELARAARQGPEGVLRDHPDADRVDRGAAPNRACARTTTGCSGS